MFEGLFTYLSANFKQEKLGANHLFVIYMNIQWLGPTYIALNIEIMKIVSYKIVLLSIMPITTLL